ncbi:methylated-DNA-protein-cysteine methyltransferase related protein [Marinomonas polaris DSM 16579]|uniref:Methylated-DNA-protein-cysteine methyltransferase related protein n=1 Tax=Marinomonas polaris DSM 16579 TaxID=1122206 RepID=A0A1M5A7R0_9GAMM|nr:MGMT family protein [Marinomonas polaris]SHF26214.1 methylated-DNA-protein-cysteine methyltransferase related protein [Marinomonas polaris DSM 16579]
MANQPIDRFKSQVFHILSEIPKGECIAYGELAKLAGFPGYARQVGSLMKNLPKDTKLPWHRVINAQRRISFAENTDGYLRQKEKLEKEGWVIVGSKLTFNENSIKK